jgi:hypothetical protein
MGLARVAMAGHPARPEGAPPAGGPQGLPETLLDPVDELARRTTAGGTRLVRATSRHARATTAHRAGLSGESGSGP